MKQFLRELNKRHVTRVALGYLVIAWVVLQVADIVLPAMGLPDWTIKLVLALLVAGFPLALILSWLFDLGPGGLERTDNSETDEQVTERAVAKRETDNLSIAVLPFPDLSAEQDQTYFCDGLTDELISRLARVPGLRVASRSSSFAFKGQNAELEQAAEKLRVAHILEGGVRKHGNRLRISAQLTEVASDTVLWADSFDHELSDIFAIQRNLAQSILDALRLQLGTEELKGPKTSDPRAYEYYLRARGYAISSSKRDLQLARGMYEKATQADPGFTDAWVGLSEVTAIEALFLDGGDVARQASARAAQQALKLSPEQGASHMAFALAKLASDCYEDAEAAFLKALELDSELYRAWHYLGRTAHHAGNLEKEIDYFNRAIELDPEDWESPVLIISALRQVSNERATRMARLAVGRLEKHQDDYPDNPRAYYLGLAALHQLEEWERSLEWAEKALQLAPEDPATRYNLACFYADRGDIEKSLDLLENSITSRSWIENDRDLDNLRDHPRYVKFLESLPAK